MKVSKKTEREKEGQKHKDIKIYFHTVYSYSELHIWYSRLKVAQTGGYKNGVELNYATTTTTTTSKASPSIIHPYSFKKLDRLESDRTITSPLSQSSSNSLIIATAYPPSLQEISKELNAARKLNSRHFDLLEAATETLRKQVYGMQTSNQKSKFKIDRLLDRNERLIEILEERRFKLVNNNHA